jgi:hypothetical protein
MHLASREPLFTIAANTESCRCHAPTGSRIFAAAVGSLIRIENTQYIDYQYFNLNYMSIIFLMI